MQFYAFLLATLQKLTFSVCLIEKKAKISFFTVFWILSQIPQHFRNLAIIRILLIGKKKRGYFKITLNIGHLYGNRFLSEIAKEIYTIKSNWFWFFLKHDSLVESLNCQSVCSCHLQILLQRNVYEEFRNRKQLDCPSIYISSSLLLLIYNYIKNSLIWK